MAKSAWLRVILGFLVAPISPGLLAVVLASLFRMGTAGLGTREWSEAMWIIGLSGLLGYPVAVAFGVPLHLFFRSRGWNGLVAYIGAGALLGFVVYLVWVIFPEYAANGLSGLTTKFSNTAQVYIPLGIVCGAVAALVFWLIARPDRSNLVDG
jgi:hypothetical protein